MQHDLSNNGNKLKQTLNINILFIAALAKTNKEVGMYAFSIYSI